MKLKIYEYIWRALVWFYIKNLRKLYGFIIRTWENDGFIERTWGAGTVLYTVKNLRKLYGFI